MAVQQDISSDNPGDYFKDVLLREEELRKINDDLDLKLEKNINSLTINSLSKGELFAKDEHLIGDYDHEFKDLLSMHNLADDLLKKHHHHNGENTSKSFENKENYYHEDLNNLLNIDPIDEKNMVDVDEMMIPMRTTTGVSKNKSNKSALEKTPHHSNTSMPTKTVNHLQKVRMQALSSQLQEAIHGKTQLSKANNELKSEVVKLQEINRRLQSQVHQLQSNITKKTNKMKASQNQLDDSYSENASLKKEIGSLRSILKECESKSHVNETKLKRAIESTEKFKTMVTNAKSMQHDDENAFQEEKKEYEVQIKDLTKQRDNLLMGFQKQMQLISLLKRQQVHLEASRLLDFNEKEFISALERKDLSEST